MQKLFLLTERRYRNAKTFTKTMDKIQRAAQFEQLVILIIDFVESAISADSA